MNSDTENEASEILAASGALTKCRFCSSYMISAYDEEAEKRAYGMATNAWKRGNRGFRGMQREEVIELIKRALTSAPSKCPGCDR